ncbi:MAG: Hcp family type VI secretion system effector [Planctomycetota bacterium]
MKTRTKKARAALAVLVPLGVLSMLFLAVAGNQGGRAEVFGTVASAQSLDSTVPVQVRMGTAIYVNFEDFDGESEDPGYEGWINLLSFKQGQYIRASSIGAVAGQGSSVFEEIILRKELDKSSPLLAAAVALGKVFPKVDIHVSRALSDGTRITYYVYELKNAVVTSYRIRGSTNDDIPLDEVSLNFEQIKVTYTKFGDYGGSESIVMYGWDVARNQPQ